MKLLRRLRHRQRTYYALAGPSGLAHYLCRSRGACFASYARRVNLVVLRDEDQQRIRRLMKKRGWTVRPVTLALKEKEKC